MGIRRHIVTGALIALGLFATGCVAPPPPPPPPPPVQIVYPPPPPEPPPVAEPPVVLVRLSQLPDFALPAPRPSARYVIDRATFPSSIMQWRIDRRLRNTLETRGYTDFGYYRVPGGFALATRIERMTETGTPWSDDGRWVMRSPSLLTLSGELSLARIIDALINADPGRYRVLVFVVTDRAVVSSAPPISVEGASSLVTDGGASLPGSLGAALFTPGHNVTVLIYEFERPALGQYPKPVSASAVPGLTQLQRSGVLPLLAVAP